MTKMNLLKFKIEDSEKKIDKYKKQIQRIEARLEKEMIRLFGLKIEYNDKNE